MPGNHHFAPVKQAIVHERQFRLTFAQAHEYLINQMRF